MRTDRFEVKGRDRNRDRGGMERMYKETKWQLCIKGEEKREKLIIKDQREKLRRQWTLAGLTASDLGIEY